MAGDPSNRPAEDPLQFSLNVPVPGRVSALAEAFRPALTDFERIRERHTLVAKRLGEGGSGGRGPGGGGPTEAGRSSIEKRVREALAGAPAFEARIDGVGAFEEPAAGPAPVVYLAVESPGLRRLHDRLCESFEPARGIEGEDYVPHVTLARGGGTAAMDAVDRLRETEVEPVAWTVGELVFWDARYGEVSGRVSLPA